MAEFDLNLSTRPFPAYRLINVALGTILVVLALLSAWQFYGFFQYAALVRAVRPDEQVARVESETLGRELDTLKGQLDRPESAAKLSEIGFLNGIIARKELSWTQLFANLEDLVPETVQLASLKPEVLPDRTAMLTIIAQGRGMPDIKDFIAALEQSPVFEKVEVSRENQDAPTGAGGVNVTLTAHYLPEKESR